VGAVPAEQRRRGDLRLHLRVVQVLRRQTVDRGC
jgi:hypothetical protein